MAAAMVNGGTGDIQMRKNHEQAEEGIGGVERVKDNRTSGRHGKMAMALAGSGRGWE